MIDPIWIKKLRLIYPFIFLLLSFSGCGGSQESGGSTSVRIVLKSPPKGSALSKVAQAPAPVGIVSVKIEITGPGMDLLSTSSAVKPDAEITLSLEVAAGPSRRFRVSMADASGIDRFRGEATADLVRGTFPNITVPMVAINAVEPTDPFPIQIMPQISVLTKSLPQRPSTGLYTIANATDAQVDLFVNGVLNGNAEFGQIAPGQTADSFLYTAPESIPIDRTKTAIGVPAPIEVEAVDKVNPSRRDRAEILIVTGPQLKFGQNRPVTPAPVSASSRLTGPRSLAYDDGKVYAVWVDCSDGCLEILFSESSDGIRWSEPAIVGAISTGVADPSIAVGPEGTLYITYTVCPGCTSSAPTIRLRTRQAGETTFKSIPLTMVGQSPQDPTVAVSSEGTVYVAWSANQGSPSQFDILLQRIDKGGNPIDSSPKNLTAKNGAFNETQPTLAVGEGEDLFLAWQVSANSTEIAATASLDGGTTFLPEVRLNDLNDQRASVFRPSLAVGPEQSFSVAWEKDTCSDGCTVIFYNVVTVGASGLEFQREKPVGFAAVDSVRQNSPSIASDGAGGFSLLFHETLSGFDTDAIFLVKESEDGALTFSRVDDPPSGTVNKSSPSLAVDSAGRAFAIWVDGRNGQGNRDLFFAQGE
jgi:hypothetical protein